MSHCRSLRSVTVACLYGALAVALLGAWSLRTSADEAVEALAIQENLIEIDPRQLTQWVFQNRNNGPQSLEQALLQQMEHVALAGPLAESQRERLHLAGWGDIQRFWAKYETVQREFPNRGVTNQEYQELWQKIQPLRTRVRIGLHGPGSLFRKTIPSVLDASQLVRFQEIEAERERRQYLAAVKGTVAVFEQRIPLTIEQRTRLIDLVMERTKPVSRTQESYYQHYLILNQIRSIPQKDLKPIFLENEWKVLQGMPHMAIGEEVLDDE